MLRALRSAGLSRKHSILVACSGGADSLALAEILARLQPKLGYRMKLASVHHGPSADPEIAGAREIALERVRELARSRGLSLAVARPARASGRELRSEAELRRFRLKALTALAREHACTHVAFAHHADDLLETRLIRLIRGTGRRGLTAMSIVGPRDRSPISGALVLRPLLNESRREIRAYAGAAGLRWSEDPSNADPGPLRNWIRRDWLPALETKRPGGTASLMRSLERLSEMQAPDFGAMTLTDVYQIEAADSAGPITSTSATIDRRTFNRLSPAVRRHIVTSVLDRLGARDFNARQIEEATKRIATSHRSRGFVLLGYDWRLLADRVVVRRCSDTRPLSPT